VGPFGLWRRATAMRAPICNFYVSDIRIAGRPQRV